MKTLWVLAFSVLLSFGTGGSRAGMLTAKNKGLGLAITSVDIYIPPGATGVTPAGWKLAATKPAVGGPGNVNQYTGNLAVNGTQKFTVNGKDASAAEIVGFDYNNAAGKKVHSQVAPDPISSHVVAGGDSGSSYLGFNIPAHEYGYFYDFWNDTAYTGKTLSTTITLGQSSGASNFQVLDYAFTVSSLSSVTPGNPYLMQEYMEPGDAVAGAGVSTSWVFDSITGTATATYANGLGGGDVSQIVGYLSPYSPSASETSGTYDGPPPCPPDEKNYALVPSSSVPEPSTLTLLGLGSVGLLGHGWRRRK